MKFEMFISIKNRETQFLSFFFSFFLFFFFFSFCFSGSGKPRMLFFQLMNVKMPTVVGILTFRSRKTFVLS